jgi:hypothetical protein
MPSPRRFPPPWSIEESSTCFIVPDGDKQALATQYRVLRNVYESDRTVGPRTAATLRACFVSPRP